MGVSIHYRGRLSGTDLIASLCEDVRDIADTMGWPFHVLDDDWSVPANASLGEDGRICGELGLKGVQITPHPESEPLVLYFDDRGYLRSPMTMLMILEGSLEPERAWVSMKTQFSSPDTHVWVIGLLKYLKKHYIPDLEVSDESDYWDTGDRRKLEESMALLDGKLNQLTAAISAGRLGDLTKLSANEIVSRIEQLMTKEEHRLPPQRP